jgi:hydrogenase expression/formation protein HypD
VIDNNAFRDPKIARGFLERIETLSKDVDQQLTLMEVCGTHTMAIHQYGLRDLVPKNIRLVSGPGCPVCVTPIDYIDHAIALCHLPQITIATFGDMVRVPGSSTSLLEEKARGADVRILYSPLDAVKLAVENPKRQIVFLGVGFETTTPTIAGAVLEAAKQQLDNFSVLCAHKTMPAPMAALTTDKDLQIDGYICPAHVSAIIGIDAYRPLTEDFNTPCVVTGFEPLDILQGIAMLMTQIHSGIYKIENQYRRFVKTAGNTKAQSLSAEIFEPCDANWRGIGLIPHSGLNIREKYAKFNAALKFKVEIEEPQEPKGCCCGEILKGKLTPQQCPLFGKRCTPENPVGACMVSSEGTCAAAYKYAVSD